MYYNPIGGGARSGASQGCLVEQNLPCHTALDAVSQGLGVRNLFTLAIADQVRNDISEDETTSSTTPSLTLSWICSTLPEFRICGFATVCSICSLSGLVTRCLSANPLPHGEGALRHCERMRSNPEKHQASSCTYKPNLIYLRNDKNVNCHTALDAVSHKLGMQDLLSARHLRPKVGDPAFLNFPQISNKTDRFRIKFGIIINRNNFPFSTFHFQFFAGARRRFGLRGVVSRVRHTTPQSTTKEVLC